MPSYLDWLRENKLYAPTSFGGNRMEIDGIFNRKPDPRAGQALNPGHSIPQNLVGVTLDPKVQIGATPPNPKFAGPGSSSASQMPGARVGSSSPNLTSVNNSIAKPTAGISRTGGSGEVINPVDPGGIDPRTNLPVGQTPVDPGGVDPVSGQIIRNAAHAARLKAAQHRKDYASRHPGHAGMMIPRVPKVTVG